MPPITLVVPVYNEGASCRRLVERLRRLLDKLPPGSRVVIVDDGSHDDSAESIEASLSPGDPIDFLRHPRNRGYGAALKTGIRAASTEWIAIADADGTYPLAHLPRLLDAMNDGARMAVGARRLASQPAMRRPAKAFLNAFASYLSGVHIPDINSGLRIFVREDALRLAALLPDGFSFTTTITMALLGEGHRVDFVRIPYRERVGSSKIHPVRDTLGFLMLLCRMALAFQPMKVFGPLAGLPIAVGVALLVARALGVEIGIASTVVLIVGGLQVFAVGLLADHINRRAGNNSP